jgi:hypothetical protein
MTSAKSGSGEYDADVWAPALSQAARVVEERLIPVLRDHIGDRNLKLWSPTNDSPHRTIYVRVKCQGLSPLLTKFSTST